MRSRRIQFIRKLGTTRLVVLSFIFVVFSGACLLALPWSNLQSGVRFIDHLFVATSATCVTGLVPYAIVDHYTLFGQCVIIWLMQVGGLGLMTLIVFVMTVLKERLFQGEKKLMHDSLNTRSLRDIPKYVHRIFKYTFIFEGCGALLLMIDFIPRFGVPQGIFNSIFTAVSAFCNAGLDNFAPTSLTGFVTHPLINIVIAMLIIMGGLGFSVWFDLFDHFFACARQGFRGIKQMIRKLSIHTKIVILATAFLIFGGTILFYIIEFNNPATLGPLNPFEKIYPAFFTSVTLRTAGFSTIDMASTTPLSQLLMCLWMLIGGSPGGTAGGIKTTSAVVLILTMIGLMHDEDADVNLFRRRISRKTFLHAFMILAYYVLFLFVGVAIMLVSEPGLSLMEIIYECVSAIATVGLSLNVSPGLSDVGKIVIICLMLFGRCGPITIMCSMFTTSGKKTDRHFPQADVLIG